MTTWPNWVDLVIIIIIFRTCYSGFGRGFLTELLNLCGVIGITVVSMNYFTTVMNTIRPWISWADPTIATFLTFWLLFVALVFLMHLALRFLTSFIKWERVHWLIQGIGIAVGGLRGLWWSGFVLVVLTSSGFTYLRASVEERSVLGPRLVKIWRDYSERLADECPGGEHRGESVVPPLKRIAK